MVAAKTSPPSPVLPSLVLSTSIDSYLWYGTSSSGKVPENQILHNLRRDESIFMLHPLIAMLKKIGWKTRLVFRELLSD